MRTTARGVFFDLYGTLLVYGDMKSAWADWLGAFHFRLCSHGLTIPLESFSTHCDGFFGGEAPPVASDGLTVFERRIHHLCGRLGLVLKACDVSAIADDIASVWQRHVQLDVDAEAMLAILGSCKTLALVSNYDHPRHARQVIAHHGLDRFFRAVVISGDIGVTKPDPRIFAPALDATGLSPSEVVYVGDTDDDVAAARGAGMTPILIRRPPGAAAGNGLDFAADEALVSRTRASPATADVATVTGLKQLTELLA
ncbi:MAG: HAD family hydrolase [Candidatus Latescibacterota bacterium]